MEEASNTNETKYHQPFAFVRDAKGHLKTNLVLGEAIPQLERAMLLASPEELDTVLDVTPWGRIGNYNRILALAMRYRSPQEFSKILEKIRRAKTSGFYGDANHFYYCNRKDKSGRNFFLLLPLAGKMDVPELFDGWEDLEPELYRNTKAQPADVQMHNLYLLMHASMLPYHMSDVWYLLLYVWLSGRLDFDKEQDVDYWSKIFKYSKEELQEKLPDPSNLLADPYSSSTYYGYSYDNKNSIRTKDMQTLLPAILKTLSSEERSEAALLLAGKLMNHKDRGMLLDERKMWLLAGNQEAFAFVLMKKKPKSMTRQALGEALIERELDRTLDLLLENKYFNKPILQKLRNYAMIHDKRSSLSVFQDYENRHTDPIKEQAKAERRQKREKNAAPNSSIILKKSWTFKKEENYVTLNSWKGNTVHIQIPADIDGVPVKKLSNSLFSPFAGRKEYKYDKSMIESVLIPEGVEDIGAKAFAGCRRLKSMLLPKSVQSIGDKCFTDTVLSQLIICNPDLSIPATYSYSTYYDSDSNEYQFWTIRQIVAPAGSSVSRQIEKNYPYVWLIEKPQSELDAMQKAQQTDGQANV